MDVEYTWILSEWKIYRQFRMLTWISFIGQFIHPVEKGWVKGGGREEIFILASCMFHSIREHENLV